MPAKQSTGIRVLPWLTISLLGNRSVRAVATDFVDNAVNHAVALVFADADIEVDEIERA